MQEKRFYLQNSLTLADCSFGLLITLKNIIQQLTGPLTANEIKLKDFYTHVLTLPWSDTKLSSLDNPFAKLHQQRANTAVHTGATIDLTPGRLTASHIKDPRIAKTGEPPHFRLLVVPPTIPSSSDEKPTSFSTPHTTANDFHKKLALMNEAQLDMLFSNIPDYPRTLKKLMLLLTRLSM